ncbi:uncharacterized protein MICPUCDRAFT_54462 [Micromonas pusilla CCMP1545]|jgi:hypothetical protein|uniref:Predicted protein n=1 Tax=Micromonas pusilla (strain CCMP1545) TaxID=564608 RepID=C1N9D4_MICPC|nr:uncharacterized protein MICPUCDRAFT_54462 [Micromonas pusilla CCMP1545]EEH51504.1 predicted protein [Micromonas pusilla CCMP1545]|tara:strand:+ start:1018 stop:1458 length:441 start_codon:yes stop_codon:yes gene_type:complete|eukprot:XP_003064599.1 predicted protein [Micromonas pusilla CCMP1545]
MAGCVTPGGIRRIRDTTDGALGDVSLQVRARFRRRRLAREISKCAHTSSLARRHHRTRAKKRERRAPATTLDTPRATSLLLPSRAYLTLDAFLLPSQVLNLKAADKSAHFRRVSRRARCERPRITHRPRVGTLQRVFKLPERTNEA